MRTKTPNLDAEGFALLGSALTADQRDELRRIARAADDADAIDADTADRLHSFATVLRVLSYSGRDSSEAECEGGEISGEPCCYSGPDLELVEWMPPQHRASHAAARNSGVYPANGALRLRLCPDCLAALRDEEEGDR